MTTGSTASCSAASLTGEFVAGDIYRLHALPARDPVRQPAAPVYAERGRTYPTVTTTAVGATRDAGAGEVSGQMARPSLAAAVSAEGTGQVTMRDLLMNTLRMRPDRIIVGEVRGAEANEMLQAMNTGHPGSMCTLHANNPRDALIRLENMLMAGSGDIPLPALRRQIAGSIDLVVQLARLRSGHRCVTSVTNVVGIENDIVTTEEMWRRRPTPVDGGQEHVFETSGRLPSWTEAVAAVNLRAPLMAALQADLRIGEAEE